MRIEIVRRGSGGGGTAFLSVDIPESATVEDLMRKIQEKRPQYYPSRQRLTLEQEGKVIVLEREKPVASYSIKDNQQLQFKDLGPQIAFRPVYIIEYLGPLVIYPLFAFKLVPWVYGEDVKYARTYTQNIALFLWVLHYAKREVETILVHEFGNLTMPVFNLFKNSLYYWGFAAFVGYTVNYPTYVVLPRWHFMVGFALFMTSLICNFICHMILAELRTPGSSELKLPRGFLFEYVTCPNYFCEIMMWFAFNILTGFTLAGTLFNICGAYQMVMWARDKHRKLKSVFPAYPKNRKIIFPFVY